MFVYNGICHIYGICHLYTYVVGIYMVAYIWWYIYGGIYMVAYTTIYMPCTYIGGICNIWWHIYDGGIYILYVQGIYMYAPHKCGIYICSRHGGVCLEQTYMPYIYDCHTYVCMCHTHTPTHIYICARHIYAPHKLQPPPCGAVPTPTAAVNVPNIREYSRIFVKTPRIFANIRTNIREYSRIFVPNIREYSRIFANIGRVSPYARTSSSPHQRLDI